LPVGDPFLARGGIARVGMGVTTVLSSSAPMPPCHRQGTGGDTQQGTWLVPACITVVGVTHVTDGA
jgi:hypothetical protein